jgi:hypothetical protein
VRAERGLGCGEQVVEVVERCGKPSAKAADLGGQERDRVECPAGRVLLAEEVVGRDAATTRRMRRKTAVFASGETLSSWRSQESSIPEATQNALVTLEWIGRAENLVIAGRPAPRSRTWSKRAANFSARGLISPFSYSAAWTLLSPVYLGCFFTMTSHIQALVVSL